MSRIDVLFGSANYSSIFQIDSPPRNGIYMDIQTEEISMKTKVQGWGNSQGLRLNKQIMEEAQISVGDEVDLCVREGAIVIEPVKKIRGRHNLADLVKQIPADYKPEEAEWGRPSGKEVW